MRLEARRPSRSFSILVTFLSLALALAAGSLLFLSVGVNPLDAYSKASDIFLTARGLEETCIRATPLIFASIGLALAFRASFWNIGSEGQIYMGAFGAGLVALSVGGPLPLVLISGFAFGALWGLIPALLRVKLKVNEALTTLMMNFIAALWVSYLVYGPWRDPKGYGFPLTSEFPNSSILPNMFGTSVNWGFFLSIALSIVTYFLMERTKLGFEIKVIGESERAATYAGMNVAKSILLMMVISAGLSGLAGVGIVSGVMHRLRPIISPGYGYTAIIIAWIARLNPLLTTLVGFLFGGLLVFGDALQITFNLPVSSISVFQALILIFAISGSFFEKYRIRW